MALWVAGHGTRPEACDTTLTAVIPTYKNNVKQGEL